MEELLIEMGSLIWWVTVIEVGGRSHLYGHRVRCTVQRLAELRGTDQEENFVSIVYSIISVDGLTQFCLWIWDCP